MKRLGMLLVLISVSMFALGCAEGKKDAKKGDAPAAGAAEKKADAPAAPAAEKKADEKK